MIEALMKIWVFAKSEQKQIKKSIIFEFIFSIFYMFQIISIYLVINIIINLDFNYSKVILISLLLISSILGRTIMNYFAQLNQTHAGYYMTANKRIFIGDKLKRIPLGYFNDKSLSQITAVATTVLDNVENSAPMVLVTILSGFINSVVLVLSVFILDYRIAIIILIGFVLYLFVAASMEKKSVSLADKRHDSDTRLVEAFLEHVNGMSVIKSFNITGVGDKKIINEIEINRKSCLDMEKLFTPYNIVQKIIINIFSVLIMIISIKFYLNGSFNLSLSIMSIILSFIVFSQIESVGSKMALLRLVSSSIDRANELDVIDELDEDGEDLAPIKHDISFENVFFSYNKKLILKDISVKFYDKTTTAIVGLSGSGKTTLCNLIARFWDVDKGIIKIGECNIKSYTLKSLMNQMSIVFQDVFLFADTIENNIKFAKPTASHVEVVEAAKKACCDQFINKLPNSYSTFIGEGGSTLSGGEKQRISIARAILKDAPIVILDEATSNIDSENELLLQSAIDELTQNKTIVMIAHKLNTIKNADNIIVIDDGKIVQQGPHKKLMKEKGLYSNLVNIKEESQNWLINK